MDKVTLNGVEVFPFTSDAQLLDYVMSNKGILVAINAEKILNATDQTRAIINRNIGYCDGIGAVLALHKKGYPQTIKIPGCELWLKIVGRFHKNKSFYLLGSKKEVIEETVAKLKNEFPGINIVGYHDGYLTTPEIKEAVVSEIIEKKPDVVFVAMGSPKQELLMEEISQHHSAVFQGLGGSFDVYTGRVERAPKWWLDHNLEFAYRLLRQPSRIKRQLPLVKFLVKLYSNQL